VKVQESTSVREELRNFIKVVKDKRIILLIPMFFSSNYFYAYQGAVNAFYFDGPTRVYPFLPFLCFNRHRNVFRSTERDVGGCWCHCRSPVDWLFRSRWHPLQTAHSRLHWLSVRRHHDDNCLVLCSGMAGHIRPYPAYQTPLHRKGVPWQGRAFLLL
jgi:hypothetical protein